MYLGIRSKLALALGGTAAVTAAFLAPSSATPRPVTVANSVTTTSTVSAGRPVLPRCAGTLIASTPLLNSYGGSQGQLQAWYSPENHGTNCFITYFTGGFIGQKHWRTLFTCGKGCAVSTFKQAAGYGRYQIGPLRETNMNGSCIYVTSTIWATDPAAPGPADYYYGQLTGHCG